MNITTIYQITIQPIATGAESFVGTFLDEPTTADVREALTHQPMLALDLDTLTTILNSVRTLPAVAGNHDTAAVNVRSAGVTIGTIRVTAVPAYSRGTRDEISNRDLQEQIA